MLNGRHLERLKSIDSIESLLEFLREDLEWPMQDADPETATFTFTADELGLKEEHFPQINAIYQIRPVTSDQPWGIFFIDFENKKLPVTLMRRILNSLVVKKRGAAAVGTGWNAGDLLFMTTYGETDDREVAFAHFHEQAGDLPTLRVREWHKEDNPEKLRDTYQALRTGLGWPPDTSNTAAWREQWRKPFKHRTGHTITTAKALAVKLAELSKDIKDACITQLEAENEKGQITKLYHAFKEALIHDLEPEDFADTFAQTVTYGLFSTAVSTRDFGDAGTKNLTTERMAALVPETSPFLKEALGMFLDVGGRKGGLDFDVLNVQEVVELLRSDETDMREILLDFGSKRTHHDPVIHFYEDYLKIFNKKKKVERGVFYTPQPVVSYIVRSVHELLQTEFGVEDGLASTVTWGEMSERYPEINIPKPRKPDDPFVVVLDPATGTATFLVEVIDVVHKAMLAKWKGKSASEIGKLWNAYVPDHLLPRLYGYELEMAPYAIAHMKVGLKLHETGYNFDSNQRVRVYLTNALEPASEVQSRLHLDWEALAHEAQAVKAVKENEHFTVVVGNPPYANFSSNLTDHARRLVQRYKYIDGIRLEERNLLQLERNLNDDYVKFWTLALDSTEGSVGVIGIISNSSYLRAATLRGFRHYVLRRAGQVCVDDLGPGSCCLDEPDENVFDIEQSVAVMVCSIQPQAESCASYKPWCGTTRQKLDSLSSASAPDDRLHPVAPGWYLTPYSSGGDWTSMKPITGLYSKYSEGMKTGFDDLLVHFDATRLHSCLRDFLRRDEEALVSEYGIKKKGWARRLLDRRGLLQQSLQNAPEKRVLFRPFDWRWCPWPSKLLKSAANKIGSLLNGDHDLCLVLSRQVDGPPESTHFFVSRGVPDCRVFTTKMGTASFFPILSSGMFRNVGGESNPSTAFDEWLPFLRECHTAQPSSLVLCHYSYAILYAPCYRERFKAQLTKDFPRIPLPRGQDVFDQLVPLGAELVALHLMESKRLDQHMTTFIGQSEPIVEKVSYSDGTVWIDKRKTRGFQGVPEEVWNFHIGGYQVCEKWLKDRGPKKKKPGRTLSPEDIDHYHRIVVALSETIRIMNEIDEAIDAHGGWPGAFQSSSA